jgi:hypothetical protein
MVAQRMREIAVAAGLCFMIGACEAPDSVDKAKYDVIQLPFPSDWTAFPITRSDAIKKMYVEVRAMTESQKNRIEGHEKFLRFLAQMQPGDELWFFSTPARYWELLFGREGYVILRNGTEVDRYTILMN